MQFMLLDWIKAVLANPMVLTISSPKMKYFIIDSPWFLKICNMISNFETTSIKAVESLIIYMSKILGIKKGPKKGPYKVTIIYVFLVLIDNTELRKAHNIVL